MINQDYDFAEQKIIDSLSLFGQMADNNAYTETDWTNGIKFVFSAIGHELGYKSFFSLDKKGRRSFEKIQQDIQEILSVSIPDHGNEWLYDIVWWGQDDLGYAEDIPLVAESEWKMSISAIQHDFQKLLLAKSKYRILIFQGNHKAIFEWLEMQIRRLQLTQAEDRYLFCVWQGSKLGFEYKLFVAG